MMPMYSQRIFCFSVPEVKDFGTQIANLLHEALQLTVKELPFLAGSVVPFSKEQPWLRDLRPEGAAYLTTKDLTQEIDYCRLRGAAFASSLLDAGKLCPRPEVVYVRDDPIEVCHIQASFVNGGLLLAYSIIHNVCDGVGISEMLKIFTAKLRLAHTGQPTSYSDNDPDGQQTIYSFDRNSVLCANGFCGDINAHPCWTVSPMKSSPNGSPTSKTVCKNFYVSKDSLQALKQAASWPPSGTLQPKAFPPTKISTHDALAALIWRTVAISRHRAGILSSETSVNFNTAVDCRTRLGLPHPYFGNVIYGVRTTLPIFDLMQDHTEGTGIFSLQLAARAIRTEIDGATGDKFRDLLAFVERTGMEMPTRVKAFGDLLGRSMLLISYYWFGMHELDFGAISGKIEAFRLPSRGLVPGVPVILPRLLDGSCEFVVNEREDVMGFLMADEVFRRFVTDGVAMGPVGGQGAGS